MIHQSKTKRKCKAKRVCDRTPPAVRQAKILAYIEEHGSSSTRALAEAHGWQSSTTRAHADTLCEQYKLHRTRVQRSDGGRDVIFNLGPAPIDPYTDEPSQGDSFELCSRPVLKTWAPCHMRDPLDCFFVWRACGDAGAAPMTAAYIGEQFAREIAQHEMTIIRDDGVHRHIRFAQPGTSCMHFDLITWPGYLCYTGDMGTYVFSRLRDMFQFFRRSKCDYAIDHRYWAEKVEAADRGDGLRKFSFEKFQAYVNTWIDEREADEKPDAEEEPEEAAKHAAAFVELRAAVREDVLSTDDNDVRCYDAMSGFRHEGDAWRAFYGDKSEFEFSDAWDGWDCATLEYTHRFLWCCEALAWAIAKYDTETAPAAAEVTA